MARGKRLECGIDDPPSLCASMKNETSKSEFRKIRWPAEPEKPTYEGFPETSAARSGSRGKVSRKTAPWPGLVSSMIDPFRVWVTRL